MDLVNPVTVRPYELKHGDVMVVTVTVHIVERDGDLFFRMYRCDYPPQMHDGIPQGSRIFGESVAGVLMPVLAYANIRQDDL